jgi:hypothetical protein
MVLPTRLASNNHNLKHGPSLSVNNTENASTELSKYTRPGAPAPPRMLIEENALLEGLSVK